MRFMTASVVLCMSLVPGAAAADMLGPGEKGVRLSIHVDATVPAGKVLVLVNTFRGADIIKPGEDQQIEWHPLRGALQLKLIALAETSKLEAYREALDSEKAVALVASGVVCAPPFDGVRTISDTLIAEEIRWTYDVTFAGAGCKATLARTEYLDAGRKVVDPKATQPTAAEMANVPTPTPPPPPAPVAAASAPANAPATPAGPPEAASACNVGAGEPGGVLAAWLLVAGVLRRRRSGARGVRG